MFVVLQAFIISTLMAAASAAPQLGHGLPVGPLAHGIHSPLLAHGVHAPVLAHGAHAPVLAHGVHAPVLAHGLHSPLVAHGVHGVHGGHGVVSHAVHAPVVAHHAVHSPSYHAAPAYDTPSPYTYSYAVSGISTCRTSSTSVVNACLWVVDCIKIYIFCHS